MARKTVIARGAARGVAAIPGNIETGFRIADLVKELTKGRRQKKVRQEELGSPDLLRLLGSGSATEFAEGLTRFGDVGRRAGIEPSVQTSIIGSLARGRAERIKPARTKIPTTRSERAQRALAVARQEKKQIQDRIAAITNIDDPRRSQLARERDVVQKEVATTEFVRNEFNDTGKFPSEQETRRALGVDGFDRDAYLAAQRFLNPPPTPAARVPSASTIAASAPTTPSGPPLPPSLTPPAVPEAAAPPKRPGFISKTGDTKFR